MKTSFVNNCFFRIALTLAVLAIGLMLAPVAQAVPYFARKYDVRCSRCHVLPPMLNEFGQRFVANGYKLRELEKKAQTIPLAMWASHRVEVDEENERAKGYFNRVEVISSDALTPWLSYFVEWRTEQPNHFVAEATWPTWPLRGFVYTVLAAATDCDYGGPVSHAKPMGCVAAAHFI